MSNIERVLPGKYIHKKTGTIYNRVTERNGIYTVTNEAGAQYFVSKDRLEPLSTEPKDEELNKYDVPKWFIEAMKSYDSNFSPATTKGKKMKAKRELLALITKRETLARIDEHHESFNDFCRAFKTDDVWNEHTEYFNKRDSELKRGLDTNHEQAK